MTATVFVNGRITDAASATIPVFDHGFLYGEGVYETLRTYGRQPFLFVEHMNRLRHSAGLMNLAVPFTDEALLGHVRATMAAHGGDVEGYIRILLTRGIGDLSYSPDACPSPSLVIIVKALPAPPAWTIEKGIPVALVGVRRNHPSALNPMMKSNNLLNNALAMQEALRSGAEEALMQNHDGDIVECSQSNFFAVRGGEILTPPVAAGLLPGITRTYVMDLARAAGLPCREARLTPADLTSIDEAFITGTTREITPVVAIGGQAVGRGEPGAITLRLLEAFRASVSSDKI